jgi:hypothetical protein
MIIHIRLKVQDYKIYIGIMICICFTNKITKKMKLKREK